MKQPKILTRNKNANGGRYCCRLKIKQSESGGHEKPVVSGSLMRMLSSFKVFCSTVAFKQGVDPFCSSRYELPIASVKIRVVKSNVSEHLQFYSFYYPHGSSSLTFSLGLVSWRFSVSLHVAHYMHCHNTKSLYLNNLSHNQS